VAKLFYDDEYQCIDAAILDSEHTYKEVAHFLWPGKKPESAYARLKACLNAEKDERLTFGEIIAICKFCDRFDPLFYMADELSHDRPRQVTKETELARLLRAWDDARREQGRLEPKIERLRSAA
jgi:hypothetical protein